MTAGTAPVKSSYPEKPITMIVPFSVGGGVDLTARELEKLSLGELGQPLLVVNKPGGAGMLALNELVESAADGYTLGLVGTEVILHPLYGLAKYHYPTALEPIAQISAAPPVLVVQASQPWKNVFDLIAYAKENPGKLKFAHGGIGSLLHVTGEMFAKTVGIKIEQVPFRGGGEVAAALLGGHVQLAFLGPAALKEHVKNGSLRVLAVPGEKRLIDPVFSHIPTLKESGIDMVCDYWVGIGAPKGLPPEIKEKLSSNFKAVINNPKFQASQEKLGIELAYLDAPAAAAKWLEENEKFAKVVQETGIADLIKAQKK
ncbi:MAG: tripartite tricarboxylate transporter substrate binding protein [Sporomusaceae bacterium]|nr:tripartite tricarboxylate transporter substrate binding protein [Sporomusaceae bacterium]